MDQGDQNGPKKPPRVRRSRSCNRIRRVNLEVLNKKNMTVLAREIDQLMLDSIKLKLDKNSSDALVKYITLVNDLRALEELNKLEGEEK